MLNKAMLKLTIAQFYEYGWYGIELDQKKSSLSVSISCYIQNHFINGQNINKKLKKSNL